MTNIKWSEQKFGNNKKNKVFLMDVLTAELKNQKIFILERKNIKMKKNNLYINSLCTGDKSVYYSEGGSLPDTSVKDDINELLEDKYTTKVNVEFVYVDSTNIKHFGVLEVKEVNDYVTLDMYIGMTGWICDERRGLSLQQAVKHIPLDRIMLETDAPYLLPRDLQEKPVAKNRNEPCFLPHIATAVAKHMQLEKFSLITAAYKNTRNFFNLC